jgi:hypothetical protein
MNPIRAIRRLACTLAAVAVTLAAAVPAALASASPGQARALSWADPPSTPPALRYRPGWNKHPPLPAHAHALVTGGLPGWQTTLIVITGALLATALAVTYRRRAMRRRATATTA